MERITECVVPTSDSLPTALSNLPRPLSPPPLVAATLRMEDELKRNADKIIQESTQEIKEYCNDD